MKRIRLQPEDYCLGHCFSLTVATADRARLFTEPKAFQTCLTALRHAASRAVARYIFDNPVRAGIVAKAEDYPYSGSLVWSSVLCPSGSEDPDLHLDRLVTHI